MKTAFCALFVALWPGAEPPAPLQNPPVIQKAQEKAPPPDDEGEAKGVQAEPLAEDLQRHVALIEKAGPATKAADLEDGVKALIGSRDPRVLPTLAKVLALPSQEFRNARKIIVMNVVGAFPKEAPDFFFNLLKKGNPTQRESATYAIGFIDDARSMETIKKQLYDENKRIRGAAIYSIVMRAKNAVTVAQNRSLSTTPTEIEHEDLFDRNLVAARKVLMEVATAERPVPPEVYDLLRRYGDTHTSEALVKRFEAKLAPDQKEIGQLLVKMFQANRRWLGRPPAPAVKEVSYTLSMQNLLAEGKPPKEIPMRISARDLETVRGSGSYLERGTQLDLAADVLVTVPQACQPRIVGKEDEKVKIGYDISSRGGIRMGIGLLGLRYWEGRLPGAKYAVATVDAERGVILTEELFDESRKRLGKIDFKDHEKLSDGSWVPLSIDVAFEKATIGSREAPMNYELEYLVHPGDVWWFSQATASEITEEGAELRAVSHAEGVTVVKKDDPE